VEGRGREAWEVGRGEGGEGGREREGGGWREGREGWVVAPLCEILNTGTPLLPVLPLS